MSLLSHLLESTLFACAVWLGTILLRSNQASVRHTLWMAASLKFLLPFSLLVGVGGSLTRFRPLSDNLPPAQMRFVMSEPDSPALAPSFAVAAMPVDTRSNRLSQALVLAWLCGFVVVLLRWRRRWQEFESKLRSSSPWEGAALSSRSQVLQFYF